MNRSHLLGALGLALLLSCCSSGTARRDSPADPEKSISVSRLRDRVDSLLADSALSSSFVGVKVISLEDGKVLIQQNAGKLFHPASNMKLLTSAAGLHILGSRVAFTTRFASDSPLERGRPAGNISVRGDGDPMMTASDLDSVAARMFAQGIRRVTGDIVGDVTAFDSIPWGSGWMWDDEPSSDEPFISPLSVNGNSATVRVWPGRSIGMPGRIELVPATKFATIVNSVITSPDTNGAPVTVIRNHGENIVRVSGRIHPRGEAQDFQISIWQPALYFLTLFRESMERAGIEVDGGTRLDTTVGRFTLASIDRPMDSVLHRINKPSDNLAAENMLRKMAAARWKTGAGAAGGLAILKEYLASCAVDTVPMILADGSGVSFYNAISPAAIVRLLQVQYQDKTTFPMFYESLPIAGVDGTLKNRMRGTRAARNVHAKTGTITGVSALSGYVTTADGKMLAFSIMCNHFPARVHFLREMQDEIMELLARTSLSSQ